MRYMTLTVFSFLFFLVVCPSRFHGRGMVDHSLDVARKAEKGLEVAKKAHAEVDKKLKETFA